MKFWSIQKTFIWRLQDILQFICSDKSQDVFKHNSFIGRGTAGLQGEGALEWGDESYANTMNLVHQQSPDGVL